MANSSFQKNTQTPVPVSKGGTGLSGLPDKNVLIGAGSNDVVGVSPGAEGNVLKSDGTNWVSGGGITPSDGSITYSKIAPDLIQTIDLGDSDNLDWSLGGIYTKTLTKNTKLTFSNYKLNKSIILRVTGSYSLGLPNTVKKVNGTYDSNFVGYISLHCIKDTYPEEVWANLNQGSHIYGYFAGGYTTSPTTIIDRIMFSSGITLANTASSLNLKYNAAGVSDNSLYGYIAGGNNGSSPSAISDRIIFSTSISSADTASNLSLARYGLAGISNGSTYGYFLGGYSSSAATNYPDRITFSTGITTAGYGSSVLSSARYYISGISDGGTYGYIAGGYSTAISATTDRIVFSTETTSANTVSNLSGVRYYHTGLSDNSTYGYFAGGLTSGSYVATTNRIVFATGATSANTASNLSVARYGVAGVSDNSIYGYFAGGISSVNTSIADRVVFSTGSISANTVSNLSLARYGVTGLSSF